MTKTDAHKHYQVIAQAIHFLAEQAQQQPSLQQLSKHIGLSEFHLQKIFTEWAGISPKQFLQYLTKARAKQLLRRDSVLETAFACGLSSASRLYDLMINCEAMTPGEYKNLGAGLKIAYGDCSSPFGQCFIATTERGICKLAFFDTQQELDCLKQNLLHEWQNAVCAENQVKIQSLATSLFPKENKTTASLKLFLKGSPFQLKVWEALLAIPEGKLATYQEIANLIKQPKAVRAVASAIARNHIALLIPCHRIIRQTGEFGQYRWGADRKQAMIAWEQAAQSF